jgi:hypothetical protein
VSMTMDQVLVVRTQRTRQRSMEEDNASTYWEARKDTLGITREMAHDERLECITQARAHLVHTPVRQPARDLDRDTRALQHDIADLEHEIAQGQSERGLTAGAEHSSARETLAAQVAAMARAFAALEADDEVSTGRGLTVRLYPTRERDHERGHDHGMSW